jgi:tetratricopeptide (TPR) repeat protein
MIPFMQRLNSIVFLLFSAAMLLGAQPPSALPPEAIMAAQEIQELQQKNRFSEALEKLDELEGKYPDRSELVNMRGSLYMTNALRDLDKANEAFQRALKISPDEFRIHFNLAEVQFVKHDWSAASAAFQKLLDQFPKIPMTYRHMVIFKGLVCEVKQDHITQAEKTLSDHFTFMDDTPAYYYSKAAIAFQRKAEAEAKDWISRAGGIFKPQESAPYVDTLIEARWIPHLGLPKAPSEPTSDKR